VTKLIILDVKAEHIEVKEGNISVPIYKFSDGRYCVDTMLGAHRKRITRASLAAAKTEARRLIAQLSSGRRDEKLLSISEAEDYRLAKQRVAPFGVSLLGAIEEWISYKTKVGKLTSKAVPEIVTELLTAK
jgi:hypothetical protein